MSTPVNSDSIHFVTWTLVWRILTTTVLNLGPKIPGPKVGIKTPDHRESKKLQPPLCSSFKRPHKRVVKIVGPTLSLLTTTTHKQRKVSVRVGQRHNIFLIEKDKTYLGPGLTGTGNWESKGGRDNQRKWFCNEPVRWYCDWNQSSVQEVPHTP